MKKLFTKFLLLAVVAMVSGNVWGDTTKDFSPTAEYSIRTKVDGDSYAYDSSTPKAAADAATPEINHASLFCTVQQYSLSDLASMKSASLALANGSGADALAIWVLPKDNTWSSSMTAADFVTLYETTTGMKPGVAGTATDTYLLKDYCTTKSTSTDPYNYFTLDLAKLKSNASDAGVVTLLITNRTSQMTTSSTKRTYQTSNTDNAKKPVLTASYYSAVQNTTTSVYYGDLASAVSAASANDEIKVLENQTLTARLNIEEAITIDGNSKTLTINQTTASGFLVKAAATVKNAVIAGADGGKAVFEFANSTDKTNFAPTIENVTVNNANVGSNGVYRIKDYAQVTLKNVVNSGITVTDGYAEIFLASAAQTTACKLAGTNTVASVYCEAGKRLYVYGATISSPIALTFASAYTIPTACVIQGSNTLDNFTVTNSNITLYVSKNNGGTNNEMGVLSTSYDLTVSSAKAATLVLPFDATIPANVKVYTLNYTSGNSTAKATEVTSTLLKNTPVYVKANEGTYTFSLVENGTKGGTFNPTSGALTGVYTKTNVPEGSYILATKDKDGNEGVGFYLSNSSTVAPFHCYLTAENSGDAKAITIDFGEADGISQIDESTNSQINSACFNLAGQRVNKNAKGIVIMNGRKYINK